MLKKVFSNFLDNSLRHGERVTEIRVSSQKSGEDLIVVWEDNGVGIAAEEKERIFEWGIREEYRTRDVPYPGDPFPDEHHH